MTGSEQAGLTPVELERLKAGGGTVPGQREGQTFEGASNWIRFVNLVKLPHTIFTLPFALVGVVLASYVAHVRPAQVWWVVLAFTSARFAAMGFNRIVDREIDGRNPRTREREIPAGRVTTLAAAIAVTVAVAIFFIATSRLNALCFTLSPIALACVFFYSYTKRFTRWSHVVLGIGSAIAPAGGYLAITGTWGHAFWMLAALAVAVAAWVAGFDILYAMQDVEFDRENQLHSIPAVLGEDMGVRAARVLHMITVGGLAVTGILAGAGWIYLAGVVVAAGMLMYEHSLVQPGDLTKLDAAFFTMNGVISVTFFGFALAARLLA